jgi:hypothetical protein
MSLSARCFLTFSEFLDALASGRQQHTPHLSGDPASKCAQNTACAGGDARCYFTKSL